MQLLLENNRVPVVSSQSAEYTIKKKRLDPPLNKPSDFEKDFTSEYKKNNSINAKRSSTIVLDGKNFPYTFSST
jgi:hypothetical protein